MTTPSRLQRFVLLALAVFATAGCRRESPLYEGEANEIRRLVTGLADAARTEPSFRESFASTFALEKETRRGYAPLNFRLMEMPTFDVDVATGPVLIRDVRDTELATLDWKFVREEGVWKIAEAPLPTD